MRTVTGVLVALLALAGGDARADDPPTARLTYEAAGGFRCPSQEALQNAVASRLGYEPFRADAPLSLDARIAPEGAGLRAELRVRREGRSLATRVMRTPTTDCAELAGALTLAISLAIDPLSIARAAPPPPPPPAVSPVPVAPAPPAPSPIAPTVPVAPTPPVIVAAPSRAPVARPIVLDVSVGVAASLGIVPRVGAGPVARFTLRVGAFSAGVEARGDLSLGGLAVGPSGAASAQVWRGAAFACAHAGMFALCGVASGGAFAAQGEGLAVSRRGLVPWAALGARVGVDRRLTGCFLLRAFLDVEAPLVHPSLTVDRADQWVASPVAASLGVLLGATIP